LGGNKQPQRETGTEAERESIRMGGGTSKKAVLVLAVRGVNSVKKRRVTRGVWGKYGIWHPGRHQAKGKGGNTKKLSWEGKGVYSRGRRKRKRTAIEVERSAGSRGGRKGNVG